MQLPVSRYTYLICIWAIFLSFGAPAQPSLYTTPDRVVQHRHAAAIPATAREQTYPNAHPTAATQKRASFVPVPKRVLTRKPACQGTERRRARLTLPDDEDDEEDEAGNHTSGNQVHYDTYFSRLISSCPSPENRYIFCLSPIFRHFLYASSCRHIALCVIRV